ncbi:MAG: tetratricopeptide repeat protein [Verrucomicrobiae bacterium]|nr:tetratricopeptide repeat protein [Verrucomicrobiae bacterium]
MRVLFACCFVFCLINENSILNAATPQEEFDQANRLFEQGQYSNAIAVYESLIKNGKASTAVYFNLGNAYFKSGKIGYAIYNYLIAQRLAPRDPDIRANIEFARKHVAAGAVLTKKDWKDTFKKLTLNEWGILFAVSFWTFFGILTLCQVKTELKPKLKIPFTISAFTLVLFLIALGINAYDRISNQIAISIISEGAIRQGPLEQSPQKFPIKDGLEFIILDSKDEWLQVSDYSGRVGWVKTNDVILLPRW